MTFLLVDDRVDLPKVDEFATDRLLFDTDDEGDRRFDDLVRI